MDNFINKKNENFIALIPAYNEEKAIYDIISQIKKYLDGIVVIDDGSLDNTEKEAKRAGAIVLRHEKNQGKGAALNRGFKYILRNFLSFEAIIVLDGDGQHNPEEITKFINAFKKTRADLILGQRLINRREMPRLRRIGNRLASWLVSKKIGQKISDSQSGFRLLSKKFLEDLDLEEGGYTIETEILLKAAQNKFQIKDVPILTIYRNKKYLNFFKEFKRIISFLKYILK